MAAAIATPMAMLSIKSFAATKNPNSSKPTKPSLVSLLPAPHRLPLQGVSLTAGSGAIAAAIFSALSSAEPAFAVQQLAEIAEADNRGVALLLPIVPAIAWVLFNILQPALNQINRMRSTKGLMVGVGLGGMTAAGLFHAQAASAAVEIAEAGSDNRGQLLLFVVAPAIAWVLFNIFQPALNQINRMRSE